MRRILNNAFGTLCFGLSLALLTTDAFSSSHSFRFAYDVPAEFRPLGPAPPGPVLTLDGSSPPRLPEAYSGNLNVNLGSASSRDWEGLKKDTYYFLFSQIFVIAILYAAPEDLSGWTDEQKDSFNVDKYWNNVRNVRYDHDRWWINYILHPYWGGAYFVRATERGYDEDEAFWYSFLLSTMFEFGAEALFENPSIQDLVFTPGFGYFVGKYFMRLRNDIRLRHMAGHELTARDRAVLIFTDPLGSMNAVIDRALGIRGEVSVMPMVLVHDGLGSLSHSDMGGQPHMAPLERVVPGLQLNLRW